MAPLNVYDHDIRYRQYDGLACVWALVDDPCEFPDKMLNTSLSKEMPYVMVPARRWVILAVAKDKQELQDIVEEIGHH